MSIAAAGGRVFLAAEQESGLLARGWGWEGAARGKRGAVPTRPPRLPLLAAGRSSGAGEACCGLAITQREGVVLRGLEMLIPVMPLPP